MKDFVMAALPWVLMGLALAIWAASAAKKARKRKEDSKEGGQRHSKGRAGDERRGI